MQQMLKLTSANDKHFIIAKAFKLAEDFVGLYEGVGAVQGNQPVKKLHLLFKFISPRVSRERSPIQRASRGERCFFVALAALWNALTPAQQSGLGVNSAYT